MASISHRVAARGARLWHLVDAQGQVLGRLAPQIATLLQGKHKPTYTPAADSGDYVVVINSAAVALTGHKRTTKLYRWHTGWMGGLKTLTARQMFERAPTRVIDIAVKGMLPNNLLRFARMRRLRTFAGAEHPHALQIAHSAAYAAEHVARSRPYDVRPRERTVAGGDLVKDASAILSPAELAELEKKFVPLEHDAAHAAKYDAWRAARTAKAQVARDALDASILSRMARLEAEAASASSGTGVGTAAEAAAAKRAAAAKAEPRLK